MPSRSTSTRPPPRPSAHRLGLRRAIVAALVPACVGCAAIDSRGAWAERAPSPPPSDTLSYGELRQKSVHNAYDHGASIGDQLARHGFRSVELDIHTGKSGRPSPGDDWYVYHVDFPGLDGSSCRTLRACLRQIDAFRRAEPRHEVLTLFVDLKDGFSAPDHEPRDLDALLRKELPDRLEPIDLVARCPGASTLEDAVAGRCRWPSLGELRGKVVVALTGGSLCSDGSPVRRYAGRDATRRAAFVAPDVHDGCTMEAQTGPGDVVFFNLARADLHHAAAIARAGLVSRAYEGGVDGGLDDPGAWFEAAAAGVNVLATDRVDAERHPWTDVLDPPPPPVRAVAAQARAELPRLDAPRGEPIRATR